jgi:hypothetical protein
MSAQPQISAATVRREFLEPAMDTRAVNIDDHDLSVTLADDLERLHCPVDDARLLREVRALSRRAIVINTTEGNLEKQIVGAADRLARDLRGIELNAAALELTARVIAARLRGPLAVIQQYETTGAGDAMALVAAGREIERVAARCPTSHLLSPRVRKELRARKYQLLRDILNGPAVTL